MIFADDLAGGFFVVHFELEDKTIQHPRFEVQFAQVFRRVIQFRHVQVVEGSVHLIRIALAERHFCRRGDRSRIHQRALRRQGDIGRVALNGLIDEGFDHPRQPVDLHNARFITFFGEFFIGEKRRPDLDPLHPQGHRKRFQ